MSAPREFSNEDLTAFLDQEADADLVRDIETALDGDAALASRLDGLAFPKDILAAAFEQQLAAAPAMPALPPMATPAMPELPPMQPPAAANSPQPPRWRGFLTGAASGLAAGLAIALYMGATTPQPQPQPGWLQIVANYQMLYTPKTLYAGMVSGTSPEAQAQLANLSRAVGADLTALGDVEGLRYRRAQQLGFNGKTLIQIAYSLPDGTPVAICILPSTKDASGPKSQVLSGMAATDWTTGTHGIVVIGGEDQTVTEQLASQIQPLI